MSIDSDKALGKPADLPAAGRAWMSTEAFFAIGLAVVLATLLVPMPTFLLDGLLSISLAVALATLVVTLSAQESIEFSSFPSLLLFVTLFRLSLNVASTRLILLQGDAGSIIAAFGNFVLGGSSGGVSTLVIGLVIYLILAIIQFVVITKGSERISEVAARFNLDAMPGKQMAIDADLNAGTIGEEEARARRQKIVKESEFYGSMDGASKFIRGDAIAGLIIVAINLVGGFLIGMSNGKSILESIRTYSILAVGDGLVSQIPALIIATASGFLISKSSTQTNVSTDLVRQFTQRSRPIGIAAFLMGAMVFVPGFPKAPFAVLAVGLGLLARRLAGQKRAAAQAAKPAPGGPEAELAPVEELLDVDKVAIHVGARLIKTVDPRRKSSLSHRVAPLRRKFAQQLGLVLPLIRLRDNVGLDPNSYEIRLNGHVVASGRLEPERFLAMDPGSVTSPIQGQPALEPVFNLPALWVTAEQKEQAELRGYTVVDPESVLMTHLSETLRRHAHELLSRDDVQKLVDRLRQRQPALVNGVIGESVPLGLLHRVLQNLLRDGIAIRDLPQVVESVGDNVMRSKDPAVLTELARKVLVRTITEQHADTAGRVMAIVLEPALEYELRGCISPQEHDGLSMQPERAMELSRQIASAYETAMAGGYDKTVLLCDYRVRPHVAAMLARQLPQLAVLAYDEIAPGTKIQPVATVSLPAALEASASRKN